MPCETGLRPPVKHLTDRSKAVLLLWIIHVISFLFLLCFRVRLFIDALRSPAGERADLLTLVCEV